MRPVDGATYALAHHFLDEVRGANDRDIDRLAEALQAACEDACDAIYDREAGIDAGGSLRDGMCGFRGGKP